MKGKTPSHASPKSGSRRGCLCENGKYSKECCDGSLQAQGIGKVVGNGSDNVVKTEVDGVRTMVRQNS